MAKSFELENKIENLKAHYTVVKQNLDQVVQQVNDAIELKDKHLAESETVRKEVEEQQLKLLALRRDIASAKSTLADAVEKTKTEKMWQIENATTYELRIENLKEEIDECVKMVAQLRKESQEIEKQIREQYEVYTIEGEEFKRIKTDRDAALRKIKDEAEAALVELSATKEAARTEEEKVASEREALRKEVEAFEDYVASVKSLAEDYNNREEALAKREANCKVYESRIRKIYKELKPEVIVRI